MKKVFVLAVALSATMMVSVSAKKTTKEYQRPSLHMVLMTTNEEANKAQALNEEIMGAVKESWGNYEFPALYNNFKIPFSYVGVDVAKGSVMDIIAMYNTPSSLEGKSIAELKQIIESLQGAKYREALKAEVDKVADEVAHQLVKKWWSISDDGSYSDTLLFRLACYSASQNQVADAAQTTMGAQREIFNELADVTIANTFVTFSKLDFYENEPIAAFVKNIMQLIATLMPAPANIAAQAAVEATYNAMKDGYQAFTNNLLYKLEWNEEIANEFYGVFESDKKINMEKFNALPLHLVYVGNVSASAHTGLNKEDRGAGAIDLVTKTCHKAIGRQFAKMQQAYEEFRPMVPVLGLDAKGGVIADMGTKEGVKVGDQFKILSPVTNEKGVTKYNSLGVVKVVKWVEDEAFVDGVWDNENIDNAAAADLEEGSENVVGTHLSKFKKATPGMFVKLEKSAKK